MLAARVIFAKTARFSEKADIDVTDQIYKKTHPYNKLTYT